MSHNISRQYTQAHVGIRYASHSGAGIEGSMTNLLARRIVRVAGDVGEIETDARRGERRRKNRHLPHAHVHSDVAERGIDAEGAKPLLGESTGSQSLRRSVAVGIQQREELKRPAESDPIY